MSKKSSLQQKLLANEIVTALFTSGWNPGKATHLKIIMPGEFDGGGWCAEAAEAVVVEILNKSKSKEKK